MHICFNTGNSDYDVNNTTSVLEAVCAQDDDAGRVKSVADLYFFGATLQLRGVNPISQPLVDTSGNLLVYNGIISLEAIRFLYNCGKVVLLL